MTAQPDNLFDSLCFDDGGALHGSPHYDDIGAPPLYDDRSIEPHISLDDSFHLTIGDADRDDSWWNWQGDQNSCAVVAQQGVLESILGYDVMQEDLIQEAQANGWYDPVQGTPPECVGNILEAHGIPVERAFDCSIIDLHDALARGDKVIVGLNANEIWYPQHDAAGAPVQLPEAGHAVWVTGIEEIPGQEPRIILNDSAPLDGRHHSVALSDFLNAWEDFGNYMVVAHSPAVA